jgi:two-component SAPR family response regulator
VLHGSANGVELALALQAEKPELKVIYTSGYSSDLSSNGLELREGVNYLPKPYFSSKLTEIIRSVLATEAPAN